MPRIQGHRVATGRAGDHLPQSILEARWEEVDARAKAGDAGFRCIRKLLSKRNYDRDERLDLRAAPDFLGELYAERIHYSLASHRPEAVMVLVDVPGERWEVEFLDDGSVEVERFISQGEILGESALDDLFARFGEREAKEAARAGRKPRKTGAAGTSKRKQSAGGSRGRSSSTKKRE